MQCLLRRRGCFISIPVQIKQPGIKLFLIVYRVLLLDIP